MTTTHMDILKSRLKAIDYVLGVERLGSLISKRTLWRKETDAKTTALTFDDGPHPELTPRLLDVLNDQDVTATFFLVGENVVKYPGVVDQIVQAGHEIGNHTYSHATLPRLSDDDIGGEIKACNEALAHHHAGPCRYFRPPKGLFTSRVLDIIEANNLRCVIGDVYPRDVHLSQPDKISNRVLARVRPGSIVILHDGSLKASVSRAATLTAVTRLIPILKQRGYAIMGLQALLAG